MHPEVNISKLNKFSKFRLVKFLPEVNNSKFNECSTSRSVKFLPETDKSKFSEFPKFKAVKLIPGVNRCKFYGTKINCKHSPYINSSDFFKHISYSNSSDFFKHIPYSISSEFFKNISYSKSSVKAVILKVSSNNARIAAEQGVKTTEFQPTATTAEITDNKHKIGFIGVILCTYILLFIESIIITVKSASKTSNMVYNVSLHGSTYRGRPFAILYNP